MSLYTIYCILLYIVAYCYVIEDRDSSKAEDVTVSSADSSHFLTVWSASTCPEYSLCQTLNLLQFRRAVIHSYIIKYWSRPHLGRPVGRSHPPGECLQWQAASLHWPNPNPAPLRTLRHWYLCWCDVDTCQWWLEMIGNDVAVAGDANRRHATVSFSDAVRVSEHYSHIWRQAAVRTIYGRPGAGLL